MHPLHRWTVILGLLLMPGICPGIGLAQQVIQRGALGKPSQVLDETQQWSEPILLSADHDVEIYMPDVSSPVWLKRNYRDFMDKHQYVLSLFTFYRTPKACQASQVGWGLGDAAHINACLEIGYRVRQATVDAHLQTVTLRMAAMIGHDGQIEPSSIQTQTVDRSWSELDPNTRVALEKATAIVRKQMKLYDQRVQSMQ